MLRLLCVASLVSTTLFASAGAKTWYIKSDGTGDAPTIQAGVDSCQVGDVVLVAPGTYADTTHVMSAGQPRAVNVHITKDIDVLSEAGPAATLIDGSQSYFAVLMDGVGAAAEFRGFTITVIPNSIGCIVPFGTSERADILERSCIRCEGSSCTIADNVLQDAEDGVFLVSASATVSGCTFRACVYGVRCSGPGVASISGNEFVNCGVGISSLDSSPAITGNSFGRQGGALACRAIEAASLNLPMSASSPTIENNKISGMFSEAIWCNGIIPTIENNTILNSSVVDVRFCGATSFRGNLVAGNTTGLALQATSDAVVEQNTFFSNATGIAFAEVTSVTARQNIVDSGTTGLVCLNTAPLWECNDVFGTSGPRYSGIPDQTGLNGNFSDDPQFCGTAGSGNYLLQSDSPCAPGNHPTGGDCDLIGAFPVGCQSVSTKRLSWGAVKALYRD